MLSLAQRLLLQWLDAATSNTFAVTAADTVTDAFTGAADDVDASAVAETIAFAPIAGADAAAYEIAAADAVIHRHHDNSCITHQVVHQGICCQLDPSRQARTGPPVQGRKDAGPLEAGQTHVQQ